MPNWCMNKLVGLSEEEVDKYFRDVEDPFQKIYPIPKNVENEYDWCVTNWGTKWDACDVSCFNNEVMFSTAWAPPEGVIEKLIEITGNTDIELYFYESGVYFAGVISSSGTDYADDVIGFAIDNGLESSEYYAKDDDGDWFYFDYEYELSDGTRVYLDYDSKVIHPKGYVSTVKENGDIYISKGPNTEPEMVN